LFATGATVRFGAKFTAALCSVSVNGFVTTAASTDGSVPTSYTPSWSASR